MTYGNDLNGGQAISFLNQINRSNWWKAWIGFDYLNRNIQCIGDCLNNRCISQRTLNTHMIHIFEPRMFSKFVCSQQISLGDVSYIELQHYGLAYNGLWLLLTYHWCDTEQSPAPPTSIARKPSFLTQRCSFEDFGIRINEILLKRNSFNMRLLFLRHLTNRSEILLGSRGSSM